MTRPIIIAIVILGTLAASVNAQTLKQASPARPMLKAEAIISGEIVRIGDLIDNAGVVAPVPIFRAPDLGYTGTVSVDAVLEAVRDHALIGVDTAGLHEIVVTRASRIVPEKDIENLIARTLSARFDLGPAKDIVLNFARDTRNIYVDPAAQGLHDFGDSADERHGESSVRFCPLPGRRVFALVPSPLEGEG